MYKVNPPFANQADMSVEGAAATVGLIGGYLCLKLARTIALAVLLCILALFMMKQYGWMADDYSGWRREYNETREQQTSYWNNAVDFVEQTSKWLQRGFLAGIWVGLVF